MMTVPTKPRVITEPNRDEYTVRFVVRFRRNWNKMSLEERRSVLQEGADALEEFVSQMRAEAAQMTM